MLVFFSQLEIDLRKVNVGLKKWKRNDLLYFKTSVFFGPINKK